jgi:hypothetical protein
MSTMIMRHEIVLLSSRFITGLLIVVALTACAVSNGRTGNVSHEGNTKVTAQNVTDNERKLDFVVSLDKQQWKLGGPILVKLRVHNAGNLPVNGICSFALTNPTVGNNPYKEGQNFWAPVIVQAGNVEPAPGPVSSTLNPGETLELEVDLNKLNWAKAISNDWPSEALSQTRVAGAYEFSFRMHVKTGSSSEKFESNKIKVSIK